MKICKITVLDNFYPDTTGRKGFQNVKVIVDILFDNKLFSINVAEYPMSTLIGIDEHDFDIWSKARHNPNYPEITDEDYINAKNSFHNHLKAVCTVENIMKVESHLQYKIDEIIQESEYEEVCYKTKDSVLKDIELLQEQFTYFE